MMRSATKSTSAKTCMRKSNLPWRDRANPYSISLSAETTTLPQKRGIPPDPIFSRQPRSGEARKALFLGALSVYVDFKKCRISRGVQ
jgi:acyl transferase domain-containing protein